MQDFSAFLLILLVCVSTYLHTGAVLAPLTIVLVFLAAIWLRRQRKQQRTDFVNQLRSHRKELRGGGTVVVDNVLLRYDTFVTTFYVNVGTLFSTIIIPSAFRIYREEDQAEGLFYSLFSLVLGWWAFPMGPLLTLSLVRQNTLGGERTSIALLIDEKFILKEFTRKLEQRSDQPSAPAGRKAEKPAGSPISTGEGSRSGSLLAKGRTTAHGKTLNQRLFESRDTRAPGERALDNLREKLSAALETNSRTLGSRIAEYTSRDRIFPKKYDADGRAQRETLHHTQESPKPSRLWPRYFGNSQSRLVYKQKKSDKDQET